MLILWGNIKLCTVKFYLVKFMGKIILSVYNIKIFRFLVTIDTNFTLLLSLSKHQSIEIDRLKKCWIYKILQKNKFPIFKNFIIWKIFNATRSNQRLFIHPILSCNCTKIGLASNTQSVNFDDILATLVTNFFSSGDTISYFFRKSDQISFHCTKIGT